MTTMPDPLVAGLEVARCVGADGVHPDDEVMMNDQGNHWEFEFVPQGDRLGGGVQVLIAKDDLRVLRVVRGQ